MPTVNYYLYDKKAKEETLILLHFNYNARRLIYSTRQKINPNYWDTDIKRAIKVRGKDNLEEINLLLNKLENNLLAFYRNSVIQNSPINNENLKAFLNSQLLIPKREEKVKKPSKTMSFLMLYDEFIKDSKIGTRLQKNGSKISQSTIDRYKSLRTILVEFEQKKKFNLILYNLDLIKKEELSYIKRYYKEFYYRFTEFLYNDCNNFDNAVGSKIKILKAFFAYLISEKDLPIGSYHKDFYVIKEEIPIIALQPEQLKKLINDKEFENSLPEKIQRIKDIFVFGCTVALRVSDLMSLTKENLKIERNNYYLNVVSKKTKTLTTIKLPPYAIDIIKKYESKSERLLPQYSHQKINEYLKELGRHCLWTDEIKKIRSKRGVNIEVKIKTSFAELLTTHVMRRTAITTMLRLGIPEVIAREISGHSSTSSEFYRYVELSRSYIDEKMNTYFEELKN
ncbi:MAG: tyrosine-type recombinase/integrase [Bacteroidales bacterium]|jgi:integrase|nr:tyrosine-type recombinase/integrase [Bacteroidales bacterium]